MAESNPFTLSFGKLPSQLVRRMRQHDEVISEFAAENPSQQVFMVSGVRGIGKTVFLTEICHELAEKRDWVVVELNPTKDMLKSLMAKLVSENELVNIFKSANIDLSFFGFKVSIKGSSPIADEETALQKMLDSLRARNKRVLIAVDEVTNTPYMREFASAFQIFLRNDAPVFLLMTGLYQNIDEVQNEDNLTFLYRAPKLELGALNTNAMAAEYRQTLSLDEGEALKMAKLSMGYSFAFQVLGYFRWRDRDGSGYLPLAQQYLEDNSYVKIWSELSRKDRLVLRALAESETGSVKSVRDRLGWASNEFSPYRQRLIKRGVITGDEWGTVKFALPFFGQFALSQDTAFEG